MINQNHLSTKKIRTLLCVLLALNVLVSNGENSKNTLTPPIFKLDTLNAYQMNEVSVYGQKKKNTTIGKSGISEMDLPQAITVIDSKLLEVQQVSSVTDLLKNVNGVYIMGNSGGYQEEIASRGTNITTTNTFKNGVRYYGGMKTEMSGIEKAEILKGSAALLYGNVAAGGILNLVTKKPVFNFGGNVTMTYGSFDQYKPSFDVYGALNKQKTIAFRLDGSYEQANSFRKYVESKTYYLNPSVLFNIDSKTTLLVESDYTKDNRTPDFGAGIINYQIADLPRDRFVGVSWGKYNSEQTFLSAKATHKFNDNLNISSLTGLRYYNTDLFSNSRPNTSGSMIASNGDWTRNIQRSSVDDNYFIEQVDLNANFNTWFIKHQFLVGADYESYKTKTTSYNSYTGYDAINIFENYNAANEPAQPTLTKNTLTTNPVDRFGIYAQDLLTLHRYFKLLMGLRYSDIKSSTDVFTYSSSATVKTPAHDRPFSPKAGIIFQPTNNNTLFATYSNSFSLNTGVDINGNALDPSTIDQYEVGVKNKLFDNKLALNLTAYQIDNSNMAQTSLENGNTNSNIKELAGATRGRGLEVDIEYSPLRNLHIMGGYSYTKTTYTKSNTYVVGSEMRYNPKNTGNISLNYSFEKGFLKNLQAGFISSYIGERYAGRSTRVTVTNDTYKLIKLNDYLQHDLMLAYKLKNWILKAKVNNVTNVMSYNVHDDNSLNPIAPISYTINVGYHF